MNSKIIFDYTKNNFFPYLKNIVKLNTPLLKILTPLLVFNLRNNFEYYNLMINEDTNQYQQNCANCILEEEEYNENERESEIMMKKLSKKTNNL